ncbi:MAG: 4Fe-4S binding protein [Thermodesulfobacteriota bacterium]
MSRQADTRLWADRHLTRLRRLVQTGFALVCLYSGWRFVQFLDWARGESAAFVPRPPAVEGFLPISALVAAKQLLLAGIYDRVHPAGLTIFLAAIAIALVARKGFCGWICPVGFFSHLLEAAGRRLGILVRLPGWLDQLLTVPKYLLFAFFALIILWQMDLAAIQAFLATSYNLVVDAKMLDFFIAPSRPW